MSKRFWRTWMTAYAVWIAGYIAGISPSPWKYLVIGLASVGMICGAYWAEEAK